MSCPEGAPLRERQGICALTSPGDRQINPNALHGEWDRAEQPGRSGGARLCNTGAKTPPCA